VGVVCTDGFEDEPRDGVEQDHQEEDLPLARPQAAERQQQPGQQEGVDDPQRLGGTDRLAPGVVGDFIQVGLEVFIDRCPLRGVELTVVIRVELSQEAPQADVQVRPHLARAQCPVGVVVEGAGLFPRFAAAEQTVAGANSAAPLFFAQQPIRAR